MHITYADLEGFLAEIHGVAPEKRIALRGRLKHFQRLGWPEGTNKGKGARVQYGIGQTLSLAMGFELLQLGLTPERVVEQFTYAGRGLADGFWVALSEYGAAPDPVYYIFAPESLAALRGENVEFGFQSMMVSRSEVSKLMEHSPLFWSRRFAFIDLSNLLAAYIEYFIGRGLSDPQDLREAIENWRRVAKESGAKRSVFVGD